MEQLMRKATSDGLQLSVDNMQKYISGPATLRTVQRILQDEMDTSSKTTCPDAMEARVRFQQESIKKFWDIIAQHQAWHQYMNKKHQVDVGLFPNLWVIVCCLVRISLAYFVLHEYMWKMYIIVNML